MDGEEGGVGDASWKAGDTCGGVEESREEPRGAASSESPEERRSQRSQFGEAEPLFQYGVGEST